LELQLEALKFKQNLPKEKDSTPVSCRISTLQQSNFLFTFMMK